jgi:hypothetical protein
LRTTPPNIFRLLQTHTSKVSDRSHYPWIADSHRGP